jgi:hypothetical protein
MIGITNPRTALDDRWTKLPTVWYYRYRIEHLADVSDKNRRMLRAKDEVATGGASRHGDGGPTACAAAAPPRLARPRHEWRQPFRVGLIHRRGGGGGGADSGLGSTMPHRFPLLNPDFREPHTEAPGGWPTSVPDHQGEKQREGGIPRSFIDSRDAFPCLAAIPTTLPRFRAVYPHHSSHRSRRRSRPDC